MIATHNEQCHCMCCMMGDDAYQKWRQEKLEEFGWIADYVSDEHYPFQRNFHTHGLPDSHDHLDLQIVVPVSDKAAHEIFWNVVREIKEGKAFKDGNIADKIINGYDVLFLETTEGGRQVLRIIFPDAKGHLEQSEMEDGMEHQYCGL